MNPTLPLKTVLQQHQVLGQQLLDLVEREADILARSAEGLPPETAQVKRQLLPVLSSALMELRRHREVWQRLPSSEKSQSPEITAMLRSTQDLLLKVILRDRENEQALLRIGQIPAQHLGKVRPGLRPHYVAEVYRRHQRAGGPGS